ncbi:MAG: orotidine-5'-phosphate decarboxylase [Candidatus Bipolaricaulaceae bacterium]
MIIDKLFERVRGKSPICLGLDPSEDVYPPGFARKFTHPAEAALRFCQEIAAATADLVACFKVQIAHFEALGVAGLGAYRDLLQELRREGHIVIGDVKRGDISSTAAFYARAHLAGEFAADFLTLNAYFGSDALAPFFPYLETGEHGLFVLVRTSNPSAAEFQDLLVEGRPLHEHVAEKVATWGKRFQGRCGYSLLGAVVGANKAVLARLRSRFPSMFFLVPGYGAQGGRAEDVAPAFQGGNGAVVVAARSILAAHRGKPAAAARFPLYAREAAQAMAEDLASCP